MISSVRTALVGVLAVVTLLLGAAPATAHTALKSSDPKKDAEIAPPTQITLTYTEVVRLPRVILTGPDGARHESGTATASGNTVTQPVNGTLADGTYTVGWRVVSADGHPVTGSYKFTVKGSSSTGEQAAPATTPTSAPPSPSPAANQSSETSSSGWLWIGLAALVIALIVGGVAWARRPSED